MADFEELVQNYASKLDMGPKTCAEAMKILNKANDKRLLAGKMPNGSAAAALYIACILKDERRTIKQLATTAKTSESTITNRYKMLVQELKIKRR